MQRVEAKINLLAGGWSEVSALIPPRACGAHNTGCAKRIKGLAEGTTPSAFDPMPEAVADAALRDVVPDGFGGIMPRVTHTAPPPNCEGQQTMYAHLPPYVVDSTRDDDEGEPAEPPRYGGTA